MPLQTVGVANAENNKSDKGYMCYFSLAHFWWLSVIAYRRRTLEKHVVHDEFHPFLPEILTRVVSTHS
jgi:hypothetical protein